MSVAMLGMGSVRAADVRLSATGGNGKIDLSWTVNGNLRGVQVMRDTDANPSGRQRLAILPGKVRNYTDNSVANGRQYWYWIKYTDTNRASGNSNAANATAGDNGGTQPIAVSGVTVTPSSASLSIGSTANLTASVQPTNATNKGVSWSSSNTGVATVNANGLVTGVSAGNANVTVTTADGGRTASSTVKVLAANQPPPQGDRTVGAMLNGERLSDLSLAATGDWNKWADKTINVFLTAGINRLSFKAYTGDARGNVRIDYIEDASGTGKATTYEAESSTNTLSGAARIENVGGASGGRAATYIGAGAGNALQFNNVNVPASGSYRMVVGYANAEMVGEHAYNTNVVERYADISVNAAAAKRVYFRNTLQWDNYQTRVVNVDLRAGNNTIRFGNADAYAPNIDRIEIAAPVTNATAANFAATSGIAAAPLAAAAAVGGGLPLRVDLSSDTGPLRYGATGSLYAMGKADVPSVNMLAPLRPQVIAQKPEGGLQHPSGDAINVSETFAQAGGREIEIYMQDMYSSWPYENRGINDYLNKVDAIAHKVVASPHPNLYSYVLFNEPDWIWYDTTGRRQAFFNDYKAVYDRVKSIHPSARTVGPNLAAYNSSFYRSFLIFCRDNHCLPDSVSWHELGDDFFAAWYDHYNDYRALESSLGIARRDIVINEYGRSSGDLGIPGQQVQWIARFETSKVDACMAYWSSAGTFGDLVAQDNYNKATGGWWAHKWYGEMTGHTVKVTPPNERAMGLQGVASVDADKKQARILFGGSTSADVTLSGINAAPYLGDKVHVTVWETAATGRAPSSGPTLKQEGDYAVANGEITVPVSGMRESSAYFMIVTPNTDLSQASNSRHEAEYATLSGSAKVGYGSGSGYSGTAYVDGYGASTDAETTFTITAKDNGYHAIRLRYAAGSN
ncbi:MAG: Ig-like domain-containing protein [Methylococcaceae bacterium]|nr:Ig-like domain-containing protein [Methylococcaceae bacterium]